MMRLNWSRRMRIALVLLFAFGLILFMPMRIALGLSGVERLGVAVVQPRITPCAPASHSSSISETTVVRLVSSTLPWTSSS